MQGMTPHDVAELLSDRRRAVKPSDLDGSDSALSGPGLYAWWVDGPGTTTLSRGLGLPLQPLIYAGQTGATTTKAGIARSTTLRGRVIGQHLRAQTRASTFALTLAAILREPLGLSFRKPRLIEQDSQLRLRAWMFENLAVFVAAAPDPTRLATLEKQVLDLLDPPLNLMGMPSTPLRQRLRELRSETRPDAEAP